jgi:hypothetical protein
LPFALIGIGLLTLLARLASRTTLYTLTNRRLVFRIGIALPTAINIPFTVISSVAARFEKNGCGDIVLSLNNDSRVAYSNLWPHVRPWHFTRPEPMLRLIPDAEQVGALVAAALKGEATPAMAMVASARPTEEARPAIISWGDVQTT